MGRRADVKETDNVFIGEDKTFDFTIVDSAGDAVDVAGWSVEWVLRLGSDGDTQLIRKTVGSGITLVAPTTNGVIRVQVDDTDWDYLQPSSRYFHTLKRIDAGSEAVLAYGDFVLQQPATRA